MPSISIAMTGDAACSHRSAVSRSSKERIVYRRNAIAPDTAGEDIAEDALDALANVRQIPDILPIRQHLRVIEGWRRLLAAELRLRPQR